jgi:hypothetical protein
MKADIDIFVVPKKDADEYERKSVNKLALMVRQFFDDEIMEDTLVAIAEKPLQGEFAGNCHNIVLAFMTDLIIARRAQGWFWVRGENPQRTQQGITWEHSWLEYNGFAVDASELLKERPDKPAISIGEAELYYKAKGIKKIIKRRNAAQTRRWIVKRAKDEEK